MWLLEDPLTYKVWNELFDITEFLFPQTSFLFYNFFKILDFISIDLLISYFYTNCTNLKYKQYHSNPDITKTTQNSHINFSSQDNVLKFFKNENENENENNKNNKNKKNKIEWNSKIVFDILDIDQNGYIDKYDLICASNHLGLEHVNISNIKSMITTFSTEYSKKVLSFDDFSIIFNQINHTI